MKDKNIKEVVKKNYAKIAKKGKSCPVFGKPGCCDPDISEHISKNIGYSNEELKFVVVACNKHPPI